MLYVINHEIVGFKAKMKGAILDYISISITNKANKILKGGSQIKPIKLKRRTSIILCYAIIITNFQAIFPLEHIYFYDN